MADIFISYARSTATQAQRVVEALRKLGYSVWIDDDLPAHRAYTPVIEEQMTAAKAAVVIWSADAVRSEWVLSEANRAREERKLVQVVTDATRLPMPFDTIQCADLTGWTGDTETPGWRKVVASIAELVGGSATAIADAPLPLPSKPSIAVMPFANLSGDPEQEYFADGMLLEIVEALSRIKSIFVIASGSSLSFKGKGVNAQEAARQLGVRYVLEGSVRRAGGRVRIGVQLIDAADGAAIWTERFEDTLEDVFALQDKVALGVAGKIEPTVQQAEGRRASKRPTENMGSYDLYLRAFVISRPPAQPELREALDHLNRAIELDPDFGPALAWAAWCHWVVVAFGWSGHPADDLRQSVELAHRALKAAGDDAQVLAHVALIEGYVVRDLVGAVGLVDRATALNPGSAAAWLASGGLRLASGDPDIALNHLETSMRLDPLGPDRLIQFSNMGNARFAQGRFGEALACFREFVQQQPDNPAGHLALATTYAHLGQTGAAQEALAVYRTLTSVAASDYLQGFSSTASPEMFKVFLAGIALAEGTSPTGGSADTNS